MAGNKSSRQWMFNRQNKKSCSIDGVDSGSKDLNIFIYGRDFKINQRPFALAYPVLLHLENMLRPVGKFLVAAQQFLGISRDSQEPLFHLLLTDLAVTAPAAASHHLFISQNCPALRTPVNPAQPAIGQSLFQHLEKNPLIPAVIIRQAGIDLS